jgi:hypothetical protein
VQAFIKELLTPGSCGAEVVGAQALLPVRRNHGEENRWFHQAASASW